MMVIGLQSDVDHDDHDHDDQDDDDFLFIFITTPEGHVRVQFCES